MKNLGIFIGLLLMMPCFVMALPQVGDRQYIRANEAIPEVPEGTLWHIVGVIQNPTMAITVPGISLPTPANKFFEVELVAATRPEVGEKFNMLDVGGYLDGSDYLFEKKIIVHKSEMVVVLYEKMVALLSVNYAVGQTAVALDPKELPALPQGYEWIETSRVSGVGSLIPSLDVSLRGSPDRVTYTLTKKSIELPDTFSLPKVESRLGRGYIQRVTGTGKSCSLLLQGL